MTILKIKIMMAVVACVLFSCLLWRNAALKHDNARLSQEAAAASQAAAGLSVALSANWSALATREAANQKLEDEKQNLQNELRAIYEKDQEARAWSDAYFPDSVGQRLRR